MDCRIHVTELGTQGPVGARGGALQQSQWVREGGSESVELSKMSRRYSGTSRDAQVL